MEMEGNGESHAIDVEEVILTELDFSIHRKISMYWDSDSSTPLCIYKVPAEFKIVNKEAYTPQLVSIGPIHHRRPELQEMEIYKYRILGAYIHEQRQSPVLEFLHALAETASKMENKVRECYQESFDHLSSDEFSEMIMVDAIFVLIFFQPNLLDGISSQPFFNRWVKNDIIHDLMLLENQLPFFVIKEFHKRMTTGPSLEKLEECILGCFSEVGNMGSILFKEPEETSTVTLVRHLVDLLRTYYIGERQAPVRGTVVCKHSATELKEAGVKFRAVPHYNVVDINFTGGELRMPTLRIGDHTETFFRNMIVFEQCQHRESKDITSYVIFMDNLINTAEDVDLLVYNGIIDNCLGHNEQVASLFNNLHKETAGELFFQKLCEELNAYKKDNWHELKAKWLRSNARKVLRRDYFNSPWSTLSVVAAVILLLLTSIQTICSMIPLLQSHQK